MQCSNIVLLSNLDICNNIIFSRAKKNKKESDDEDYNPTASTDVKQEAGIPKPATKHKFECANCDKTYPTWRNLVRHRRIVHEGRVFKCTECDNTYTERSHLKQHMGNIHKDVVFDETKSYDPTKPAKPAKVKQEEEVTDENKPVKKKRKRRAKAEPGYGPTPEKPIYQCHYCEFSAKHTDWINHLRKDHADKNLVIFQATSSLKSTRFSPIHAKASSHALQAVVAVTAALTKSAFHSQTIDKPKVILAQTFTTISN